MKEKITLKKLDLGHGCGTMYKRDRQGCGEG